MASEENLQESRQGLGELQSTISLASNGNLTSSSNELARSGKVAKDRHHKKRAHGKKATKVDSYEQLQSPASIRVRSPTTRDSVIIDESDLVPFSVCSGEPLVDQQQALRTLPGQRVNSLEQSGELLNGVPVVFVEDGKSFKRIGQSGYSHEKNVDKLSGGPNLLQSDLSKNIVSASLSEQRAVLSALRFEQSVSVCWGLSCLLFGGMAVLELGSIPYTLLGDSAGTDSVTAGFVSYYASTSTVVSRLFFVVVTFAFLNSLNLLIKRAYLTKEPITLRYSRVGGVETLLESIEQRLQPIARAFFPKSTLQSPLSRLNFSFLLIGTLIAYILSLVIVCIDDTFNATYRGYGPFSSLLSR